MNAESPDEFYKRLKIQLADSTKWPSLYLYKFIVLTDDDGDSSQAHGHGHGHGH